MAFQKYRGFCSKEYWTPERVAVLKEAWPRLKSWKEVAKLFPEINADQARRWYYTLSREDNLSNRLYWTVEREARLAEMWATEPDDKQIIHEFGGKDILTLAQRAARLGVKRMSGKIRERA